MDAASSSRAAGAPAPGVAWEHWTAEAFARAKRERKPVLLSLAAFWCHGCDVMDRTTYADPRLVAAIHESCVPVRVDTDRRPDVNARYNLDGWPTTALLTPGGEILTGSTYLAVDALRAMLDEGRAALRDRYDELTMRADQLARARRAAWPAVRYEPDGGAPAWVASRLFEEEDREHGGFGARGKFLPAGPLAFALAWLGAAHDDRAAALVARTLDAVCCGGLFDEADGGCFRYAANRDFTRPHTGKLLDDQAALVTVLIDAGRRLGRPDYHRRALDVIAYVQRTLADPASGAFFASQQADDEYYALGASIRASLEPPAVDRTVFIDLNAQAAAAWCLAGETLGRADLTHAAARTADRVLLPAWKPETGFAHWLADEAPCTLLGDQVHAAWALLHLFAALKRDEYLAAADAAMRLALRRFWDPAGAGFLDRAAAPDDVGLLREPRKPLALNALAARVLVRLAAATGARELHARAREALGSVTATYRAEGIAAAPYAAAVMDVLTDAVEPDGRAAPP